jgi:hypothetical protein
MIARGYRHYCHVVYPLRKEYKWEKIDRKLIKKYGITESKDRRSRLKKKGIANFYFLRWYDQAVIFHTAGEISDAIIYDDHFYNVTEKALEVKVSDDIRFRITREKSVTVRLTKDSYRGLKAVLWDVCTTKDRRAIIREFDKFNGIPSWKGIIEQKRMLAAYVVKQARQHQVHLKRTDLRISTKRKIYKPFSKEQ